MDRGRFPIGRRARRPAFALGSSAPVPARCGSHSVGYADCLARGVRHVVLSVSADDSPAYFLAPNDLVSQVKQSAALRPVPDVSVRVSLEVPASCWSGGWRCTFRFAVVGAECSLHRVFSPPAPSTPSVQGPTTTQIEANLTWFRHAPVDAKEWAHCSEILKPDGYGSLLPVCLCSCSVHSAETSTRFQDLR